MTHAFGFEHNGKRYGVVGKYSAGDREVFSITIRLHRSELRTSIDAQSGVKLEGTVAAASEADLVSKLEASYPGLTNFSER
jgi:hypothetical protein